MVRVGIVGGGRGAQLLLSYLLHDKEVHVAGIYDVQTEAVGIQFAKRSGVNVASSLDDLVNLQGVDTIIEVTGRPEVRAEVLSLKPSHVSLIDSDAARFFIERIRSSSERSLQAADTVRLRFDDVGQELARSITMIKDALDATEDIAGQTEVLSINAAIEASRAPGESGRTFGVVANEIQRVAANTKKATNRIGEIMESFSCQAESIRKLAEEMVTIVKDTGL